MDEARAMLDELMGKTRDLTDDIKKKVRQTHFSDKEVCKDYLCGVCPYLLFTTTKSDMGKCPMPICGNPDAEECRREYERLSQDEREKYGYEYKLMNHLDRLVQQCDRRIEKNREKAHEQMAVSEEDVVKIAALQRQRQDLLDKCEAAAEAGYIDNSMAFLNQSDQAKDAIEKITNPYKDKKITVCEISGNYISNRDNDERMRAHFEGKQYLGWKLIRETLAALKARQPPLGPPRDDNRERGRVRDRDRTERERSEREKDSSRRNRNSRERSRDRGASRGNGERNQRRSSKSRERSVRPDSVSRREPSPVRNRGGERDRRRDRSRSADRNNRKRQASRSPEKRGSSDRRRSRSRSRDAKDKDRKSRGEASHRDRGVDMEDGEEKE